MIIIGINKYKLTAIYKQMNVYIYSADDFSIFENFAINNAFAALFAIRF